MYSWIFDTVGFDISILYINGNILNLQPSDICNSDYIIGGAPICGPPGPPPGPSFNDERPAFNNSSHNNKFEEIPVAADIAFLNTL